MARWLGIDHGTKRMGVAVGEAGTGVASPVEQVPAGMPEAASRIRELAGRYDAAGAVVGWPLNADGSEGRQGRLARVFAVELARQTHLDVRLWDERLSSFEADQRLKAGLTRAQKKRRHDSVAAAAFLEDFLARGGPLSAPRPEAVEQKRKPRGNEPGRPRRQPSAGPNQ